jgi:hypothetical protein
VLMGVFFFTNKAMGIAIAMTIRSTHPRPRSIAEGLWQADDRPNRCIRRCETCPIGRPASRTVSGIGPSPRPADDTQAWQ